jgi:hypothetical protein
MPVQNKEHLELAICLKLLSVTGLIKMESLQMTDNEKLSRISTQSTCEYISMSRDQIHHAVSRQPYSKILMPDFARDY